MDGKGDKKSSQVSAGADEATRTCSVATNTSHLKLVKARLALQLIRQSPEKWFRDAAIDQRDLELLSAEPLPWLAYDQSSFVRKIYHCKEHEEFQMTDWTVETDNACKEIVRTAGGQVIGFQFDATALVPWQSMKVNVNVTGTPTAPFVWGFLSTKPRSIRIFEGPTETCSFHPWDAMILRDCTWTTDSLGQIESIASRKWDILAMKMCEDFDSPWTVVAIKDAGRFIPDPNAGCYSL